MADSDKTVGPAASEALPYMQQAFKTEAYQRTIKKVAGDLNKRDQKLSRVVHTPAIESAGNALAHTLMRPYGILGGGIASLLGTVVLLYLARYNGLEYSFSAYFVVFGLGYMAGLLAEWLLKLKNRYK